MNHPSGLPEEPDPFPAIEKITELFDGDIAALIPPQSRAATVAYGLCMNLIYQAGAVLVLDEKGLHLGAAPIRRSMIEFLVRLLWLADSAEPAVDALNHDLQAILGRLAQAAKRADVDIPPEVIAKSDATRQTHLPPASERNLLQTKHVTDAYGLNQQYVWWLSETQTAHPSLIAVQLFVEQTAEATVLHHEPQYVKEVPAKHLCLSILFQAALAMNELLIGRPWTELLRSIGEEFSFSLDLPKPASS
ncbi:hypothetical protein [Actinomadura litoris]|uniref:hypothetical protein n=1 Tax=Actinomadura litoris TaxID=2678616 RepID=UPI001FA7FAA8|nr:hypothetical protein [Actinomadura litoris]